MKDKNGRKIKSGDKVRLHNGTEILYGSGTCEFPHYLSEPFDDSFTDELASIILYDCEVVAPLAFEGKVITYSIRPGESFDCILVPAHSGIKPGDTVVVRVKK